MFSRAAGWMRSSSGRISLRISPRSVAGFDESVRHCEPALAAELLGLFAPHAEERPDDAVVAAKLDSLASSRARRAGRGSSRPGRRACDPSREARRRGTSSGRRAARPRSRSGRRPARPRRRSARRTTPRRRPTPRRAGRGRRAAPRPGSRARAARGRGRSSPRRPTRDTGPLPPGSISSWRRTCCSMRSRTLRQSFNHALAVPERAPRSRGRATAPPRGATAYLRSRLKTARSGTRAPSASPPSRRGRSPARSRCGRTG